MVNQNPSESCHLLEFKGVPKLSLAVQIFGSFYDFLNSHNLMNLNEYLPQKVAVCLKALTELSARPVSSCTIMSIIRLSKITDDLHFMIRA